MHESVFGEDRRRREAFFETRSVVQEFFTRDLDLRPVVGADPDNSAGTDSFDDQIGLETDLNSTAASGSFARLLTDIQNRAS
jgi:hypothetical protein